MHKQLSKEMQQFLQSKKFTIDVHHGRRMATEIYAEQDDTVETVLSRSEYNELINKDGYFLTQENENITAVYLEGTPFGDLVNPNGGFTLVVLTDEYGNEYRGKYNFRIDEPFCKSRGVLNAMRAALHGTGVLVGFKK